MIVPDRSQEDQPPATATQSPREAVMPEVIAFLDALTGALAERLISAVKENRHDIRIRLRAALGI